MEQKVNIIGLGVADVAASTAFYQRLGWIPSSASGEAITFFQAGGLVVSLFGRGPLAEEAGLPDGEAGRFGGVTLAHNLPDREAVDALMRDAEAAGARITAPAQDRVWGGYSGYFADPDGHVWEVAWNPHFGIELDGTVRLPD